MDDLQFEVEFLTRDQASQNTFVFACHLTSTLGSKINWDPCHQDWIASAANRDVAQAMITTQNPVNVLQKGKWIRAPTMDVFSQMDHRSYCERKEG